MDDKKDLNENGGRDKENDNPLEIPENQPYEEPKPIKAELKKAEDKNPYKKIKIAYAVAIILALAAAFTAKIQTDKTLGKLTEEDEQNTVISTEIQGTEEESFSEDPDFQVRQNLEDVPDERDETETSVTESAGNTEKTTENGKYAKPYEDYFVLPLGTDILKDYSPDTPSYNATMGDWRTHPAVDFAGADGSQVKAISYGKVTLVYDDALYGTVVQIDHGNGVSAKYCGFNKDTVEVKKGDTVESGQLLGYLGTVPCEKTDLSHLHFEITVNGETADPLAVMSK